LRRLRQLPGSTLRDATARRQRLADVGQLYFSILPAIVRRGCFVGKLQDAVAVETRLGLEFSS
jgi:hypothetical protein